MKFNEYSRGKIPAILNLTRLGYTYLSLKGLDWGQLSNIVPSLSRASVAALNPTASPVEIEAALGLLDLALDNEELGKQFYEKITANSGLKFIYFTADQLLTLLRSQRTALDQQKRGLMQRLLTGKLRDKP